MGYQGTYEILRARLAPFIHEIVNHINAWRIMPDTWQIGSITHIHKEIARLDVTTTDQYAQPKPSKYGARCKNAFRAPYTS